MNSVSAPSVRLTKCTQPSRSWIGGAPSPEIEFIWPTNNERRLDFIAQIDLAELGEVLCFDWLPTTGTLLFFYDIKFNAWGFDPNDRGSFAVIFAGARCEPRDASINQQSTLGSGIEFQKFSSLPSCERDQVAAFGLTDEEEDAWIEGTEERRADLGPEHQIGGFPSCIQSDQMELECALVSNGLYCGNATGYNDPRVKELERTTPEWKLLLQIDTDEDIGFMWGDSGSIYYWVKEGDANRGDFSNAWMILQCY